MKPMIELKIIMLIIVTVILFYFALDTVYTAPVPVVENTDEQVIIKSIATKKMDVIAFDYLIKTSLKLDGNVSNKSLFTGKLVMKYLHNSNEVHGQIIEGKIVSSVDNKTNTIKLNSPILFTSKYIKNVFHTINLLELDSSHPANAIKILLHQMSYQFGKPLEISSATHSTDYTYEKQKNLITRNAINRQHLNGDLNLKLIDEDENWKLILNQQNNFELLEFTTLNTYESDSNKLELLQEIKVESVDYKSDFFDLNFKVNANLDVPAVILFTKQPIHILNEGNLLNSILQLKDNMQNETLAEAIGIYLSENYNTEQLLLFLNNNSYPSVIIYALQKANTIAAETSLITLLEHPDIDIQNQQKVILSLGRFKNSTDYTFISLKNIADNKQHKLSKTALLNLGTLSKIAPNLSPQINQFLADELDNSNDTTITLMAIKNSRIDTLNNKISNILGHENYEVNIAALKILAKDPKYQNRVIEFAMNSINPKEIAALTQSFQSSNHKLSQSQKEGISNKLSLTQHPILKSQLIALLNSSSSSF